MSGPPSRGTEASIWARRGDDQSKPRDNSPAFVSTQRNGRGRGRPNNMRNVSRQVSGRAVSDAKASPLQTPDAARRGDTATTPGASAKGRGTTKAPIRPSLAVDVLLPNSSEGLSPNTPSRSSRRRRTNHKRAASAAHAKGLIPDSKGSLAVSPSSPLLSTKDAKDHPPHLPNSESETPVVHDLRQEITSLVDHVRTLAMDTKRPESPGTHIDWAGDDDDSLPDLDDWGITSKRASDTSETDTKVDERSDKLPSDSEAKPEPVKIESISPLPMVRETSKETQVPVPEACPSPEVVKEAAESPPAKRERRRERGSRNSKKNSLTVQPQLNPGSQSKKSLLERLSDPVVTASSQTFETQEVPPKPRNAENSSSNTPFTHSLGERQTHTVDKEKGEETKINEQRAMDSKPDVVEKVIDPPNTSRSIDWFSEEPMTFDSPPTFGSPKAPTVDVKPATPVHETPSSHFPVSSSEPGPSPAHLATHQSFSPRENSDRLPNSNSRTRARNQRPMSNDSTPRLRAERSPHKTHTARNHSMPHVVTPDGSPSQGARTRQPGAIRPKLRTDALAMIAKNLRDHGAGTTLNGTAKRDSSPSSKASS